MQVPKAELVTPIGAAGGQAPSPWMHGLIEFSSQPGVTRYLIVPEDCDDHNQVAAMMCEHWGLSMPKLLLTLDGGMTTLGNWFGDLWDPAVWEEMGKGGFETRIGEIYAGVASACAESGTWVFGGKMHYGRQRSGGKGNDLVEGKYIEFGNGNREVRKRGSRPCVFLSTRVLEKENFFHTEQVLQAAVEIQTPPKVRLRYPDFAGAFIGKDGAFKPEVTHGGAECETPENTLLPYPTHIIFTRQNQRFQYNFPDTLARHVPRACLIAHGYPEVATAFLNFSRTMPVIVLDHSGGAADVCAALTRQFRQAQAGSAKEEGISVDGQGVVLFPRQARQDRIVVLDARADSIEKVVDRVMQCVAAVEDEESRQLGNERQERERLLKAWETVLTYKYNAKSYGVMASVLQYTVVLLSLLTTLVTVVHTELKMRNAAEAGGVASDVGRLLRAAEEAPAAQDHVGGSNDAFFLGGAVALLDSLTSPTGVHALGFVVAGLPLLIGLFTTLLARFTPLKKWASLVSTANRIRSEIYMYRARVGEFAPRVQAVNLRAPVRKDGGSGAKGGAGNPGDAAEAGAGGVGAAGGEGTDAKTSSRPPTRRGAFAAQLERLNSELIQGEMKTSALTALPGAPGEAFRKLQESLVGARQKGGGKFPPRPAAVAAAAATPVSTTVSPGALEAGSYAPLLAEGGDYAGYEDVGAEFAMDDALSAVTTEEYMKIRLQPILDRYRDLAPQLSARNSRLQVLVFLLTTLNAFLALCGVKLWIAVAVASVSAVKSMTEYEMVEERLSAVNNAIMSLQNLLVWWGSLSLVERRLPESKAYMVESVEQLADADMVWSTRGVVRGPKKSSTGDGGGAKQDGGDKGEKGGKES